MTASPAPALTDEQRARFERILDAEFTARAAWASVAFAPLGLSDAQHDGRRANLDEARARLFAMIDALDGDDAAAFGAYRLTVRAAQ